MENSRNRASLWLGAIVLAILIAVPSAFGVAQPAWADLTASDLEAQSVVRMPDVSEEMVQATYWSDKQKDPTALLADRAKIDALNKAGVDADGTMLQPLKEAAGRFYTQEEQARLKAGLESDLAYFVGEKAQDLDGNILTEEEAAAIAANCPSDGSTPRIEGGYYAIVTKHTTTRNLPTDRMIGLTPGDKDDDNLYLSMLRVNEPLLVRAQSVDGKFYLCISSCLTAAWVPAEDIAICTDRDEWLAAWDIPAGQELVVTDYKVRTEQSRQTPNTSDRLLYMGTVLERVDLETPEQALEIVGTRSAYNRHVCYLPVRNDDGTYSKELALIAESAGVNEGYLPLTAEGIAEVAFHSLGQMYGWGGMLEANDCSGYVRDIYKCFGLELARNTTWQMNLPVRKYNLEGLSDTQKAAAIAQMPLGTVLFWGGHEMLYLGQDNGKLYVISALGGIGDVYHDTSNSYQVKAVSINTLDMLRPNHNTWLTTLTCANVPYVPNSEQGPGLFDMAFYDEGITWPESSYVYTGSAITPNVEVPWLQAGLDYEVSFANNIEIGTAMVTITGKSAYSGSVSRAFEIVSPSLKQAKVVVPDQLYTGDALDPTPTVTIGESVLEPGVDYETSYSNNTYPGTAAITVTGIGRYNDAISTTFRIGRASLEHASIIVEDQIYTGKALKPELTVSVDGITLDSYSDYHVSYNNNVEVGVANVTITGKGDYVGSSSATFEIKTIPINDAAVEVADQVYTGNALEPKPLVRVGKTLLDEGTDYEVAYKDNINVGTAAVTVTGKGAYSGSVSKTFEIRKASQKIEARNVTKVFKAAKKTKKLAKIHTVDLQKTAKVSAKTPVSYVKANKAGGDKISIKAKTGKVTVKKGLKKGTYKVQVKLTADADATYKAAPAKTITLKVVIA